ncbi:MAG: helix-turn-helix domain-containing protein [Verrucomicrobiota bacterium]
MNKQDFKRDFWDQVGPMDQLLPLLDSLHDTAFFFKDRQSRHTMNNLRAVASAGVATEAETIGKIGHEFWHSERMAIFVKQDEEVMRTGKPIINALCPTPERGSNAVIVYSKIPLRDAGGSIVGLAGVWREAESIGALPPAYSRLMDVIDLMHEHYAEPLQVKDMASQVGLSRSQFGRIFRQLFGLSPHDYLKSVRINAAAELLRETELKTTEIALQVGFYDHSHFSKVFKEILSLSPRDYRKKHSY